MYILLPRVPSVIIPKIILISLSPGCHDYFNAHGMQSRFQPKPILWSHAQCSTAMPGGSLKWPALLPYCQGCASCTAAVSCRQDAMLLTCAATLQRGSWAHQALCAHPCWAGVCAHARSPGGVLRQWQYHRQNWARLAGEAACSVLGHQFNTCHCWCISQGRKDQAYPEPCCPSYYIKTKNGDLGHCLL